MTAFDELLSRNRSVAETSRRADASMAPTLRVGIVTCLDPRVEPGAFLGLAVGEAMVIRNAGGRVTDRVVADLSFTTAMARAAGTVSGLEIAVVHHTGCGTRLLADDGFRTAYAAQSGYDADALLAEAVTDPYATVRADVALLQGHPLVPPTVTVTGHVYDLGTGLVETVVPAPTTVSRDAGAA